MQKSQALMKQNQMQPRFVICVQNEGSDDLELRKVYQVLADESAAKVGYIRVIDESGEDYLYPANYFVSVELTDEAERAFSAAVR